MQGTETIAINDDASLLSHSEPLPRKPGSFGPGDVAQVFCADFFNSDTCREWVINRLHPHGEYCPDCGAHVPEKFIIRFRSGDRLRCSCGKFFTALTNTFLSGCQLDTREVILLAILLFLGVGDKKIAEFLRMSTANVRLWRQKFEALDTLHTRENRVPWVNGNQPDMDLIEVSTTIISSIPT